MGELLGIASGRRPIRYLDLLLTLLAFFVLQPFFSGRADFVLALFGSFVFIAGLQAISTTHRNLIIGLSLAVPALVCDWLRALDLMPAHAHWSLIPTISFHLFVTFRVLRHVFSTGEVTKDTLYGAACCYLLVGLTWAWIYQFNYWIEPDSFRFATPLNELIQSRDLPHGSSLDEFIFHQFFYYSMVTLTTLGYGDIVPIGQVSRSMSVLEAVFGVLYVAILVARLVSLYTVAATRGDDAKRGRGRVRSAESTSEIRRSAEP